MVKAESRMDNDVTDNEAQSQYLTFQLAEDIYALDILKVKEIFEYENLTAVPMVPDFIRGVLNLRGQVVPVIDLVARFGGDVIKVSKKTCIIIVEIEVEKTEDDETISRMDVGVMVDVVNRVVDLQAEQIEPPPSFGAKIRTDFISGMGKVDDEFMILLDVTKVLSIHELIVIDAMQSEQSELGSPVEVE